MARTVVGLFDTFSQAQSAVEELERSGFSRDLISVVARDQTAADTTATTTEEVDQAVARETADPAASGAETGAAAGAIIGGGLGLAAGLGGLALPGLGAGLAAGPPLWRPRGPLLGGAPGSPRRGAFCA